MNDDKNNKISPFQKARFYIYRFFHFFTYKDYGSYLKGIRFAHGLLEIAIICLIITPFMGKNFSILGLSMAYLSMGVIIIVTMRGKPIEKSSKVLTQYFDLAKARLHLRVYDYAPYNAEKKEAKVLFNLFPETNNVLMLYRLIVKTIKKQPISYGREFLKIKQIIKYMRKNPENETHDQYQFYLNLPDEKETIAEIEKEAKRQHFKLVEVDNTKPIRPINITSLYYTGFRKLEWKIYEIR